MRKKRETQMYSRLEFRLSCLSIIFILLLPFALAGWDGCWDSALCDDYAVDWGTHDDPIVCKNSAVSTVATSEVFTIFGAWTYTCSGTESIPSFNAGLFEKEEFSSDSLRYHNRTFTYSYGSNSCSASTQRWRWFIGVIHDLNSDYDTSITSKYQVIHSISGTSSCPQKTYSVSASSPNYILPESDYGIFQPYPKTSSKL